VVKKLVEKGLGPNEVLADTAFGSGENIVGCAAIGVKLFSPVRDPDASERTDPRWEPTAEVTPEAPSVVETSSEHDNTETVNAEATLVRPSADETASSPGPLGLDAFKFDSTFGKIETCPAGNAPKRQEAPEGKKPRKATFDGEQCRGCPLADRCPTRVDAKTGDRTMKWQAPTAATETRQREQKESTFKELYQKRSGVESTMEELKGRHGARDLRVRRRPRVALAVLLKGMAINTKRAVQYHLEQLRKVLIDGPKPTPATV
jgi:hypothetical protein